MALNIPPHLVIIGSAKVAKAKTEFDKLVNEVAGENIIAQITVAGKTKLIADVLKEVAYYGGQGSLWEVYAAVEKIAITPEMAPFLTEDRRQNFKNRIIQIISSL